jgi:hypothetical protein
MRLTGVVCLSLIVVMVGVPVSAAQASTEDCSAVHGLFGPCTGGVIRGDGVSVHARDDKSAPTDQHSTRPERPEGSSDGERQSGPPPVRRDRLAADVDSPCRPGVGLCADGQHAFLPPAKAPTKPADPAPAVPAAAAVTLADVAQFVPRDASIRSQPNGWAIVGAPVNLFTDAAPQVVDGQLLGRPAQVRFVPVSFTWDHGDGTSSTVVGPGASWRELGQQDFTATDTSHVYSSIADRQVTLTISYSPSYRFDVGAWQQIPGTLPVQVGPVTIHVVQGSTVLVAGACGERHAGPGCP